MKAPFSEHEDQRIVRLLSYNSLDANPNSLTEKYQGSLQYVSKLGERGNIHDDYTAAATLSQT